MSSISERISFQVIVLLRMIYTGKTKKKLIKSIKWVKLKTHFRSLFSRLIAAYFSKRAFNNHVIFWSFKFIPISIKYHYFRNKIDLFFIFTKIMKF